MGTRLGLIMSAWFPFRQALFALDADRQNLIIALDAAHKANVILSKHIEDKA